MENPGTIQCECFSNVSNNNYLAEKILNNPVLVEHILSYTTDDLTENLKLRNVNKQFNNSCLKLIRQQHRSIILECTQNYAVYEMNDDRHMVIVNNELIFPKDVSRYLKFLKDVAKVKIENVSTKDLWRLKEETQRSIHNIIISLVGDNNMKTWTGMDDICTTACSSCMDIAMRCRSYGPIQTQFFEKNIEEEHRFEELVVTDYLLDHLANKCAETVSTKEDCFKMLDQLISGNIQCKRLVFCLAEFRRYPSVNENNDDDEDDDEEEDIGTQPFPREVLEMMLEKWKPKSITVRFIYRVRFEDYYNQWSRNGWFTGVRFDVSDDYNLLSSKLSYDQVTIDAKHSCTCSRSLLYNGLGFGGVQEGYENLIFNVLRLFPTKHIHIDFSENAEIGRVDQVFDSLLGTVFKSNRKNLRVDVRLPFEFPQGSVNKSFKEVQPTFWSKNKLLRFTARNSQFIRYNKQKTRYDRNTRSMLYVNQKYIGRQFEIFYQESNLIINLDAFINSQSINEENEIEKAPKYAFLKYFIQ